MLLFNRGGTFYSKLELVVDVFLWNVFYTHIITFQIAKYSFDKNVSSFQIIVFKQLIWASKEIKS